MTEDVALDFTSGERLVGLEVLGASRFFEGPVPEAVTVEDISRPAIVPSPPRLSVLEPWYIGPAAPLAAKREVPPANEVTRLVHRSGRPTDRHRGERLAHEAPRTIHRAI